MCNLAYSSQSIEQRRNQRFSSVLNEKYIIFEWNPRFQ